MEENRQRKKHPNECLIPFLHFDLHLRYQKANLPVPILCFKRMAIHEAQLFSLTGGPHRRCYFWVVYATNTSPTLRDV